MNSRVRKFVSLLLVVGLFAVSYLWLNGIPTAQLSFSSESAKVPDPKPGQKKVVLKNLGMSCPFCKAAVSAKLKQLLGVLAYDVDVKSDSATVLYDPVKVTIEKLKQAIAEAGFQVRAVEEVGK